MSGQLPIQLDPFLHSKDNVFGAVPSFKGGKTQGSKSTATACFISCFNPTLFLPLPLSFTLLKVFFFTVSYFCVGSLKDNVWWAMHIHTSSLIPDVCDYLYTTTQTVYVTDINRFYISCDRHFARSQGSVSKSRCQIPAWLRSLVRVQFVITKPSLFRNSPRKTNDSREIRRWKQP